MEDETLISKSELISNALALIFAAEWISKFTHLPSDTVLEMLASRGNEIYSKMSDQDRQNILNNYQRLRVEKARMQTQNKESHEG